MHTSIIKNYSLFNYVSTKKVLKVKYETEEFKDISSIHYNKNKFLQFTPPENISKKWIKGVVIASFKKLESQQPGFYETVLQPTNYFIPISTLEDLIRIKIGEATYITEEAKVTENDKILKVFEDVEVKAFKRIFEYLITESKEMQFLKEPYKILIPSLEFYSKFKDEYITGKIIARLRSDEDIKNIYTEIIDAIIDESQIVKCLSKIIVDCKTISLIYGDLRLKYGRSRRSTIKKWHPLFYNAFNVALRDKESCTEIKNSLKNFDLLADVIGRKRKLDGKKLAEVVEKEFMNIFKTDNKYKLEFRSRKDSYTKLTFQQELKQMIELCVWHLQIQCSYFFNILLSFQKICKSVQVDLTKIVNYENTELKVFKQKFFDYLDRVSSSGSRIHDDKFINSLKEDLLSEKLNLHEQKQDLYDILSDPSVFLQFILLIESPSSSIYLYSGYYVFEGIDTLVPFVNSNTLMVYDSISELPKPKFVKDVSLKNEIKKSTRNSKISKTETSSEILERTVF